MKTDLTNIKNIIFDLGRVILNLDFDASIKAFKELGLSDDVLANYSAYPAPCFYEQEIGIISPKEFLKKMIIILGNDGITEEQVRTAWLKMVLDIPPHRVKVLQQLSEKYNIYLFSNSNKIHIDHLDIEFRAKYGFEFSSLFVTQFYSHEIHERKPDLSSFEKVIQLSGVNPAETLFIDDLKENIEGAEKAGLKTFWLKDGMEMAEIF
ncbi:MAG: HAD family phosphatase [Draconibacterium sp.]|nr:HAD family phosphatase [Bacteroidales bacterium]MCF6358799.1 HAD family phosphatase [Draconibacterium sp.]